MAAAPGRAAVSLHTRLVWVTVFRTVATSLFLLSVAVRLLTALPTELSRADTLSFAVIVAAYVSTLGYGLMLRRGRVGPWAARGQVVGDVLVASALVFLTGGPESPLVFAYSLAVLGAAVVIDWRGALLTAAGSAACFTLLVVGVVGGWLAPPLALPLSLGRAAFLLASNVLALFLVAVLAGYLARELTVAGGALSEREADLERLGTLHAQILHALPSGLITCDRQGLVTFINPTARAILGLPEQDGRRDVEALLPGVRGLGSRTRRRELAVTTPGGVRTLGLTLAPLTSTDSALLIVFQDLTDMRRMEQELQRNDRLAAVGTLAAQLAHEVRNPLAAMRGSAQLLHTEPGADPATTRLTDIIVREADRLSGLVEDFLRFARPPPPRRREVALDALVSETVDMLRADVLARSLRLDVEAEPARAQVDPDQLRQVLINLLRNAFQAAGPGGAVRASVQHTPDGPRIRVWDSAGSIADEDLPRLFEPFFTTREGGTGLGLSTAHGIVRAHGGTLSVRSSPEAGTEFVIGLPASAEAG